MASLILTALLALIAGGNLSGGWTLSPDLVMFYP